MSISRVLFPLPRHNNSLKMLLDKLNILFLITFVVLAASNGSNAQGNWDEGQDDTPCRSPRGQQGRCVALGGCPALYNLIMQRPITPEATTHLRRSQCGYAGNQPKVCCPLDGSTGLNSGGGGDGGTPAGAETSSRPVAPNPNIPDTTICGDDSQNKVYGGEATDIGEFPWMALLEYTKPNGKGFYCGGVLISSRYVLTAAHCVRGPDIPSDWRLTGVRLGEWNTKTDPDCADDGVCSDTPIDVEVESTVVHNQYAPRSKNQHHDIALIRLANPVPVTDWVKPVCLPIFSQRLASQNHVGEDLFVAGWGKTETKSESDIKLKLRVPVISTSSCAPVYQRAGRVLGSGQLCAGGKRGKDSCRGDSGGPLMYLDVENGNANWYVGGIVSFGPTPCGQAGWPGVYTKVASYGNWISSNIRD